MSIDIKIKKLLRVINNLVLSMITPTVELICHKTQIATPSNIIDILKWEKNKGNK